MIPEKDWKWYGNAGHLCVSSSCRFHLTTEIGEYFVSTVGEYIENRGDTSFATIGSGSEDFYESMVFKVGSHCSQPACGKCGLPQIHGSELFAKRYGKAKQANKGHLEICYKLARGEVK